MKTKTYAVLAAAAMALVSQAFAAPTCTMTTTDTNGVQAVQIVIDDTGLVFRTDRGQTPPPGVNVYVGTGRPDVDRTVSCSDAPALCAKASWFVRFDDAKQGWPGDEMLSDGSGLDPTRDPRVNRCVYNESRLAQACVFRLNDGMKASDGTIRMHFSAKVGDQVVSAYQPQSGCPVTKDGNPHVVLAGKP